MDEISCPYCGKHPCNCMPASVPISGLSEATIVRKGEGKTFRFDQGSYSGEIVNASLAGAEISGVTPQ